MRKHLPDSKPLLHHHQASACCLEEEPVTLSKQPTSNPAKHFKMMWSSQCFSYVAEGGRKGENYDPKFPAWLLYVCVCVCPRLTT